MRIRWHGQFGSKAVICPRCDIILGMKLQVPHPPYVYFGAVAQAEYDKNVDRHHAKYHALSYKTLISNDEVNGQ
jgi:hypothetical protein